MGGSTARPRGSSDASDPGSGPTATVGVVALVVATSLLVGLPLGGSVVAAGDFADFTGSESEWVLDGKDASFAGGDLELTNPNPNREGVGFYDRSLSHEDRYLVEFTYVAEHDRKRDGDAQGDGVLLFAVDGSKVDGQDLSGYRVTRGAESDLGYYEENVPHAYLGVGFDRSGPFSTHWYDEDEPNEPFPHSVTIRGDEEVHPEADVGEGPESIYEFVERTRIHDRYGERVDTNGDETDAIDVRVLVEPQGDASLVTVEMRWDRDGEWVRVHDRVRYDSAPPEELKFGVAAATGPEGQDAGYNEHVVRSMQLTEGHTVDGTVTLAEEPVDRPLPVELSATNGSTAWNETVVLPAGETTVDYRIDGLPTEDFTVSASVADDGFVVAEDGQSVSTATGALVEGVDFTLVETPPNFDVSVVDHPASVTEGETVAVDAEVTNTGGQDGTQEVQLADFEGAVVDATNLTLGPGATETVTLTWATEAGDAGEGELTVHSDDTADSTGVIAIEEADGGDPGSGSTGGTGTSDDDGTTDEGTSNDTDDGTTGDDGGGSDTTTDGTTGDGTADDTTDNDGGPTDDTGDGTDDDTPDDGAGGAGDDGSGEDGTTAGDDGADEGTSDDDPSTGESAVSVVGGSLRDDVVTVGEPVTVEVVVENTGDETTDGSVAVTVDGETEATREVTLEPGETRTISTTITFDEPGEYTVGADGRTIGTVTVGPTREAGALAPVRAILAAGVLLVLLLLAARALPAPEDEPGA